MPSVSVTGHQGFIGQHIYARLQSEGYLLNGADIREGTDFTEVPMADVIVHCAAKVSVTESLEKPELYIQENLQKLAVLLRRVKNERPNCHFIFLSTGAVYGETTLASEGDASLYMCEDVYASTKLFGEWLVQTYCQNFTILRLVNVTGEGQDARGEANCLTHFKQDDPIVVYGGEQSRDFIDVSTVAEAVARAIANKTYGTYNISSGVETSVLMLARIYADVRGVPLEIKPQRQGEALYRSLNPAKAQRDHLL